MTSPRTEEDGMDGGKAANTAADQIKTSLLAALGAGDLAGQVVADAVTKAKARMNVGDAPAQENAEDPSAGTERFRERLDPAELRALFGESTGAALKLYHRLAESGGQTWERVVGQPQVKHSIAQLGERLHTAQERVDEVASDVRGRVDEVMTRVTGGTSRRSE